MSDQIQTITPRDRAHWLVFRAARWIDVARPASDSRRFGREDMLREVETHMFGAYITVLALVHVRRCLKNLGSLGFDLPPDVQSSADLFFKSCTAVRLTQIRNQLEHEEDRVGGVKSRRVRPYSGSIVEVSLSATSYSDDGRLVGLRVLGTDCNISPAIDSALALAQPLMELSNKAWP